MCFVPMLDVILDRITPRVTGRQVQLVSTVQSVGNLFFGHADLQKFVLDVVKHCILEFTLSRVLR